MQVLDPFSTLMQTMPDKAEITSVSVRSSVNFTVGSSSDFPAMYVNTIYRI